LVTARICWTTVSSVAGLHRDVGRAVTDTAEALDERLSVAVGEWGRVGRPRRDGVDGARIIVSWCRLHLHSEVAGIIGAFLDEAGELRRLTPRPHFQLACRDCALDIDACPVPDEGSEHSALLVDTVEERTTDVTLATESTAGELEGSLAGSHM